MKYIRKKLIITGVIMVMGLGLTGCTKTDENAETSGGSAVEAEDLPGTKEQGDEEEHRRRQQQQGQGQDPCSRQQQPIAAQAGRRRAQRRQQKDDQDQSRRPYPDQAAGQIL